MTQDKQIVQNANQSEKNSEHKLQGNDRMDVQQRKIATLKKEADIIYQQWESEMSDEQRSKLWLRLEQKQSQLKDAEQS